MGIFITATTPRGVFIGTALDAPGALELAERLDAFDMTDIKIAEKGCEPVTLEEYQAVHARPWPYRPPVPHGLPFGAKPRPGNEEGPALSDRPLQKLAP